MRVKFFGTRGSIATPGDTTLRYGGNTSCVEIVSNAGTRVIVDAGTGAAALSRELFSDARPTRGHLLISHTHWDHIQGIPFFAPLFVPGSEWHIYGPRGLDKNLVQILASQMEYTYFPVSMDQMGASIHYHDLMEGTLRLDDILVTSQYLNHPALTLGYRLEADGAVLVYACDHEPFAQELASGRGEIHGEDLRHAEFLRDADLVIHDAQYLAHEYETKKGWGHSTPEYAFALSRFAGVRQLALTHHDPNRRDAAIDELVITLQSELGGEDDPEVFAAAEGQCLEVAGSSATSAKRARSSVTAPSATALSARSVLLAINDENLKTELMDVAEADCFTVFVATLAEAAIMATSERPSVIVLGDEGEDTVAACRSIRALGKYGAETPIVLVTQDDASRSYEGLFADRLVAPFTPAYARTRLRAWTMRVAARWRLAPKPDNEAERLASLWALDQLDSPPEERFDRITRLACALFEVPIALITLIDADRQWFKSACGLNIRETSRDVAFCPHAIYNRAPLIVPDALADDRFADNPVVQGPPRVRFYAGYPLFLNDGACVGTLCLVDTRPHELSAERLAQLRDLAELAASELQRREAAG